MKTNEELRKDVMAEIAWDPELLSISPQIGVAAKDGVVTLSGTVDTYRKKLAVEKAAQRVAGVKVVASDVDVRVGFMGRRNDTDIAIAVKNALRWNSALNNDEIEVKVDNGWVYLDGVVEWEYEKTSAQQNVEDLQGVRGVTTNISIRPKNLDARELQKKIAEAYQRNAALDASSISIESSGNKITLRGKVRSWIEKKEAGMIAWAAPGVMSVDNQIQIDTEVYA